MVDKRKKDLNWSVADDSGSTRSWDEVQVAVLMDIRDELKRLNTLLHCSNFVEIPSILRTIKRNTIKKRKPRVDGKPKLRVVARS
jgi:hypothetical protein